MLNKFSLPASTGSYHYKFTSTTIMWPLMQISLYRNTSIGTASPQPCSYSALSGRHELNRATWDDSVSGQTRWRHPGGFLPWPPYRRSPDQATTQETTLHSGEKGVTAGWKQGDRTCVWVRGGVGVRGYRRHGMRAEKMRGSGERLTSWGAWGEGCVWRATTWMERGDRVGN